MKKIVGDNSLIPVVNFKKIDEVKPLVSTYLKCGIDIIEVTLRSEVSLEAIRLIKKSYPQMKLGAGTVLDAKQVDELSAIGVDFIVSPGYNASLASYIKQKAIPYMPGVQTASEVMAALSDGYTSLKFFPAEASGGVAKLKALSAAFGAVNFCPTGGITPENMRDYLALPCVNFLGGSFVAKRGLIEAKNWAQIEQICAEI